MRDLNKPTVFGVGYTGIGKHKISVNGVLTNSYVRWKNILKRCYSKKSLKEKPTYKDVTVCEEWHNFQVFAEWYEENYNPEIMEGWHLDKDILCPDCKIYSHKTCCFVPNEINTLFINSKENNFYKRNNKFVVVLRKKHIGYYSTIQEAKEAYKVVKEAHIKKIANKWKNKVSEEMYNALINYKY